MLRMRIHLWDQITSIVTWLRRPPKVVPSDTEGARMSPAPYAEIVYLENVVVDATDPTDTRSVLGNRARH
jgi:hypothetical protein